MLPRSPGCTPAATPRRARALSIATALLCAACAAREPARAGDPLLGPPARASRNPVDAQPRDAPPLSRFTVLFRRADDAPLSVRAQGGVLGDEHAEPPLAAAVLAAALDEAAAAWNATGVVRVQRVEDALQPAELVVSFARGEHGDCPAFGRDRGVAHVWPPVAPTELHLDAGRRWSSDAFPPPSARDEPRTHSLVVTLVHELGHAFGLGHSHDTLSAMFGDSSRPAPVRSDVAGVRSLYGAARAPGPGDVVIEAAAGARVQLCDVAPPGASACALIDVDRDGFAELLVWRTDDVGHGILVIYRFDAKLQLVLTQGPFVAALLPGSTLELVQLDAGVALRSRRDEYLMGRLFDASGVPGSPLPIDPELEDAPALEGLERGDVDGDGRADRIVHGPTSAR